MDSNSNLLERENQDVEKLLACWMSQWSQGVRCVVYTFCIFPDDKYRISANFRLLFANVLIIGYIQNVLNFLQIS